jgi:hypothetical protein
VRLDHLLSKELLGELRFFIRASIETNVFRLVCSWVDHRIVSSLNFLFKYEFFGTLERRGYLKLLLHAVGSLGIGKPKTKDQIIPSGGFYGLERVSTFLMEVEIRYRPYFENYIVDASILF